MMMMYVGGPQTTTWFAAFRIPGAISHVNDKCVVYISD
jgi:hypothetical protein